MFVGRRKGERERWRAQRFLRRKRLDTAAMPTPTTNASESALAGAPAALQPLFSSAGAASLPASGGGDFVVLASLPPEDDPDVPEVPEELEDDDDVELVEPPSPPL